MTLWLVVRICAALILIRRPAQDGSAVLRREAPATRLIFPSLLLCTVALVANHLIPRIVAGAILFVLDIGLIMFCVAVFGAVRNADDQGILPERRLEGALSRFFPQWLSRMVSADLTVFGHALVGAKAIVAPPPSTGISYVHDAKIALLGIIVALSLVPDAIPFC